MKSQAKVIDPGSAKQVGRALLADGQVVQFRLGGNSMFPCLRKGDVAEINQVPWNHLVVGMIVVFEQNDRWTAHRLVRKGSKNGDQRCQTQGDNVLRADDPFSESDFIGVIQAFSRNGVRRKVGDGRSLHAWTYGRFRPVPQACTRICYRITTVVRKLLPLTGNTT